MHTQESRSARTIAVSKDQITWETFTRSQIPSKLLKMLGLLILSRVGVYIPLPGIDTAAFSKNFESASILGFIDALAGIVVIFNSYE